MKSAFLFLATLSLLGCATSRVDLVEPDRGKAILAEMESIISLFGDLDYNKPNPRAVEQVMQGERSIASAAWWGFDSGNATICLQAAIDSGAQILLVPNMGQPWQVDPLFLTSSNQEIIFESGVIVRTREGSFQDREDHLFTATSITGLTLRGYGATLEMRKKDYQNQPYIESQHRHCVAMYGCRNIRIFGLTMARSGGDGIYISGSKELTYSENVHIKDVVCTHNHRQGISVISAQNLFIENSRMRFTSGHAPKAGIDFEPNFAYERLVHCLVRGCEFRKNAYFGILLYLHNLRETSEPVSIAVEGSVTRGNRLMQVWASGLKEGVTGEIYMGGNDFAPLRFMEKSPNVRVVVQKDTMPAKPPIADAGGPYRVSSGESFVLEGSGSRDEDGIGGIIRWEWDLDNDGQFGEVEGDRLEIDWEEVVNNFGFEPGRTYPIRLRVLDDDYEWSEPAETSIQVAL